MNDKTTAAISYITILGFLAAMFLNKEKDSFTKFHLRQAFGIHVGFFIIWLVNYYTDFTIISFFWGFFLALWLFGLINAIQGKDKPVPIVGEKFQEWFSFIN